MADKFEELNSIFDTDYAENNMENIEKVETQIVKNDTMNVTKQNSDLEKDYNYTRGNLYSIIERGQEALNGVLELAQETEQPRAYEVAGQLIKSVTDATEKLLDVQKKLNDLTGEKSKTSNQTNVTNALFVGSTAELSKFLKSQIKYDSNMNK